MDETGFTIGQEKVEKVITVFSEKNGVLGSAMLCKLVIVIECISAEGRSTNLFLVLAEKNHLEN